MLCTYLGGSRADIHSLAYNDVGTVVLFGTKVPNSPHRGPPTRPRLGPATDVDIYGVDTQPNGVDCFLASFVERTSAGTPPTSGGPETMGKTRRPA